ncbi:hypothetical protein [Thermocoleostomius sinensis]|uniref:Lipoprotein n=1 Tax=Thermocoleostomius sinensis A174 TaxID=2016057 RepID=A0A9E9C961_9CYAN|nr:hypothetical protein [Thermocoleostomius sinensis]WAL61113.1 hypothetical protein OXH18_03680 [Thermocoleostomius sinensis A174]
MQVLRQHIRQRSGCAVVAVLSLLVTSCTESRVAQCQKLIDVANQVVTDVQTVAQNASATSTNGDTANRNNNNSTDSVAVITKVAEAAEKARVNMQALSLDDETLVGFQTRYADMYTEIRQTTRDMLAAAEARDQEAGREAYDNFKTATSREAGLVEEINAYCATR